MTVQKPPLTYRDAGVDIEAGYRLVDRIRDSVGRTRRPEVLGGLGGFGGLFQLDTERYRQPVLVGATDGVGTKLKLAIRLGRHRGIGIDLVAMCVNDIVVQGAEPLFFLDYYATGRLDVTAAGEVIDGIARGCELAGAALIGGETAELPGMYHEGDYDLAGFCVGVVERDRLIDGQSIRAGDTLIGLASSGPHSNGYSLIRKVIETSADDLDTDLGGRSLADCLIEPTRIYVPALLKLFDAVTVRGVAHVTGGGLPENLPRILPDGLQARVDTGSWPIPAVFDWLQEAGGIATDEMRRTFNCGVGMVIVTAAGQTDTALESLRASGETAWPIGIVEPGEAGVVFPK